MQVKRRSKATIIFCIVPLMFLISVRAEERCYPSKVDPSWNRNDNKVGTACYKQVQNVRKLEFDPRFDCSKEIRQRWQREMEVAKRMNCKL